MPSIANSCPIIKLLPQAVVAGPFYDTALSRQQAVLRHVSLARFLVVVRRGRCAAVYFWQSVRASLLHSPPTDGRRRKDRFSTTRGKRGDNSCCGRRCFISIVINAATASATAPSTPPLPRLHSLCPCRLRGHLFPPLALLFSVGAERSGFAVLLLFTNDAARRQLTQPITA